MCTQERVTSKNPIQSSSAGVRATPAVQDRVRERRVLAGDLPWWLVSALAACHLARPGVPLGSPGDTASKRHRALALPLLPSALLAPSFVRR